MISPPRLPRPQGILYPEEWDEDIPEGVDDEEKVFMIKSFEGKSPEQRRAMKKQFEKMSEADKEAIEHHLEHSADHTVCFDWCDAKIAASPQARNLASSHSPSP